MNIQTTMLLCALCLFGAGCTTVASPRARAEQAAELAWCGNIADHQTRFEDVQARLGKPSETLDGGKVILYRLASSVEPAGYFPSGTPCPPSKSGRLIVEPREDRIDEQKNACHRKWQLVMAIDPSGVIVSHRLIPVVTIIANAYRKRSFKCFLGGRFAYNEDDDTSNQ